MKKVEIVLSDEYYAKFVQAATKYTTRSEFGLPWTPEILIRILAEAAIDKAGNLQDKTDG